MISLNRNVYNIISKIESEIKNSPSVMGKAMCDKKKLMELISKLKKVLQEHEEQLAKQEQEIRQRINEEIRKRVSSSEIVEQARQEAAMIIKTAEEEAKATRDWANRYAMRLLETLEGELTKVLSKTRELRVKVNERISEESAKQPPTKRSDKLKERKRELSPLRE